MTESETPPGETVVFRPSWTHNGFLALGCLILAAALFRMDQQTGQGAVYMSGFLIFSAAIILSTHLPGCTGVWVDRDGFLVRDMYRADRYRWDEVSVFVVRRKVLGKSIEFSYSPSEGGDVQSRSLPRGLTGSVWGLAKKMNDWRAWAVDDVA